MTRVATLSVRILETTRDGTKIGFLFRFFYPFSYHLWEGAQPMIGGGGGARSDVTVVLVMEQVVTASWRSNKKGEVKEK